MSVDCYFDASGCLVCPEEAAVPAVPAYTRQVANIGWNAGADSVDMLTGDVHTVFGVDTTIAGVVVGLKSTRLLPTVPNMTNYAFYFQQVGAATMVQVIERGAAKTDLRSYTSDDVFEVRRSNGVVTYWQNGDLIYTSATRSSGGLVVNACLYASGDSVQ